MGDLGKDLEVPSEIKGLVPGKGWGGRNPGAGRPLVAAARSWVREPEVGAEDIRTLEAPLCSAEAGRGTHRTEGYEALDTEPRTSGSAR